MHNQHNGLGLNIAGITTNTGQNGWIQNAYTEPCTFHNDKRYSLTPTFLDDMKQSIILLL